MIQGVDVSLWQPRMDWARAKGAGVKFAFIKYSDGGSNGICLTDPQARINYAGTKNQGIINGAYHFFRANFDTAMQQANYFAALYNEIPPDSPPVFDFESLKNSSQEAASRAQVWLERVEELTGKRPIIYTSLGYMAGFYRAHVAFMANYPLWLAQYIEGQPYQIPYPWQSYLFWQYKVDNNGYPWGTEAGDAIDLNWYNGTLEDLYAYAGLGEPPGEEPPGEEPPGLFAVQVKVNTLNVRSGPGLNYPIVTQVHNGDILQVADVGGDVWVNIGAGWVAVHRYGVDYCEIKQS